VAALGGAGKNVSASDMQVPAGLSSPFLADSVQRLAAGESAAKASSVAGTFTIFNDAGRFVLFYRLDHSLLATVEIALGLARSAAITQTNTSDLTNLAAPGKPLFTFDNSNEGMVVVPGGLVMLNAAGRVLGSVGVATGAGPVITVNLAQACLNALPRPNLPTILEGSIPMAYALAAANAVLAAAAAQNVVAVVAIAGRDTVPRLVVASDGCSPASVRIAIKKAQTALLVPVPTPRLNSVVRPGVGYDVANSQGGLVTYSGVAPLEMPGLPQVGGVGVVSDGQYYSVNEKILLDDMLAQIAANSTLAARTASTLVIPPASAQSSSGTGPSYQPMRTGSATTLVSLRQACDVALANLTHAVAVPAVCAARDASGLLRFLFASDALAPATVDFAVSGSLTALAVLQDPLTLQSELSPALNETTGEGILFTLENAASGSSQRAAVLPGATGLVVDSTIVGSLAVSSGLTRPAADKTAALAAAQAMPTFFTGPSGCPAAQTLRVVDEFLTHMLVDGNITAAELLTAGVNFTLTWHGPANLVPFAGTFSGQNALASFLSNRARLMRDFRVNPLFAPFSSIVGVRTVSNNCETVVKQWSEIAVVISTGKAVSNAMNTVVYVVNNGLIQSADFFVDSMQYAEAFCAGQVACGSLGGDACQSDSISAWVRGLGGSIVALVLLTLLSVLYLLFSIRRSGGASLSDTPYAAMRG
jgi:uncharacterized protein GlcG (DUF336 family)